MENLSLFDTPEGIQEQIHVQPLASLDVVKMELPVRKHFHGRNCF